MGIDGETRRCLLELVYDVLPEDEASQLRERIDTDAAVAEAYLEAQRIAGLLGEAARLPAMKIELRLPDAPTARVRSSARSQSSSRSLARARRRLAKRHPTPPWTRGANLIACLLSLGLMLCCLAGYWYHRGQLADISAEHLRLTVIGPAKLQPGAACEYLVVTSAVTGDPVCAEVEFSLLSPDGQRLLMSHEEKTDEEGCLWVTVPAETQLTTGLELKVVAAHNDIVEQIETRLVVEPPPSPTLAAPPGVPGGPLPAEDASINVSFYPEGGNLVAGLENRVYVVARDAAGKPIELAGRIEDHQGDAVAAVETTADGLGVFSLEPRVGDTYRLKIEKPAGAATDTKLSDPVAHPRVVLTTGSSLFEAGQALEFNVRATEENLPLVVAAYCRESLIGFQAFVTEKRANAVVIEPDDAATGVIRLCVFDYSENPPRLVADRLVFRRANPRLKVAVEEPKAPHRPGDKAQVSLAVTGEDGKPQAAALDVAVVATAASAAPGLGAGPLALGAEAFLADDPKSAVALDLLLGTQPPSRRPDKLPAEKRKDGREPKRVEEATAGVAAPLPPAVFDNLLELRKRYQQSLSAYQTNRTKTLSTLTVVCFFGAAGLLLLATMFTLMNVSVGFWVWIPSVLGAATCLWVGTALISPATLDYGRDRAIAFVPFQIDSPAAADQPAGEPKPATAVYQYKREGTPAAADPANESPRTVYRSTSQPTDAEGRLKIEFDVPEWAQSLQVRVDARQDDRRGSHVQLLTVGK